MKKRHSKGFSLAEMLSVLAIFGLIASTSLDFFILSKNYFITSSAAVDTLTMSQQAMKRLSAELQETDPASVQFSLAHNSVVFISARDSSGNFKTSSGAAPCSTNPGYPCWQKWVFYELNPDPNGPYSILIRKESTSIFGGLPSSQDQTPPANWQTQFQNYTAGGLHVVASAIQTLSVQDNSCDVGALLHSPYYIQIISTVSYQGKLTTFNPGQPVNTACTGTGYWVQAQVINP